MFKTENEKIYRLLCEEAIGSEYPKHRHAACIVHKGRVLSIGTNRQKSHPMQKKFADKDCKIFLHAELSAIIQVINRHGVDILTESELYVLRLTKGGNIGNSKPCTGCAKAIEAFGIEKVFWT